MPWIFVDLEDLPAHADGVIAQFALLVCRGLVEGRDAKIENGSGFARNDGVY
jgi:hypothetical protein